jgi:hypothetical protein
MKKKKIKYDLTSNGQEAVQKWRTGEFHLILVRFCWDLVKLKTIYLHRM